MTSSRSVSPFGSPFIVNPAPLPATQSLFSMESPVRQQGTSFYPETCSGRWRSVSGSPLHPPLASFTLYLLVNMITRRPSMWRAMLRFPPVATMRSAIVMPMGITKAARIVVSLVAGVLYA